MYRSESPGKKTKPYIGCSNEDLNVYIRRNDDNQSLYPGVSWQWSDGAEMVLDLSKESEDRKVYNWTQRAGQ